MRVCVYLGEEILYVVDVSMEIFNLHQALLDGLVSDACQDLCELNCVDACARACMCACLLLLSLHLTCDFISQAKAIQPAIGHTSVVAWMVLVQNIQEGVPQPIAVDCQPLYLCRLNCVFVFDITHTHAMRTFRLYTNRPYNMSSAAGCVGCIPAAYIQGGCCRRVREHVHSCGRVDLLAETGRVFHQGQEPIALFAPLGEQ